jgi:hypothetical protein
LPKNEDDERLAFKAELKAKRALEGAKALEEYRAQQEAVRERTSRLRKERLARTASGEKDGVTQLPIFKARKAKPRSA